ncbi:MAG: hypothetical protein V9F04_16875 [Dermatophilaceae bacterium]
MSFLLLIGTTLIAESARHIHIPKGYIYFAMGFSVFVELLNIRARKPKTPVVHLHEPYVAAPAGAGGNPPVVVAAGAAARKEVRPVNKSKKKAKR